MRVDTLIPPLGRRAWWLLFGYTLANLGLGLTGPFLLIYLHSVRGLDLGPAGLVIASAGLAGVLSVPASGWLVDRAGAGSAVVVGLLASAGGALAYLAARGPAATLLAALLAGAGAAGYWNGLTSLLAVAVPPEGRTGIFAVAFALQNLGYGVGAAAGGLIVDVQSPASFAVAFMVQAALMLSFAAVVVYRREARREPDGAGERPTGPAAPLVGYAVVLRDRALLVLAVIEVLVGAVTMALLATAFPAWVTGPVGASSRLLGLAFTVNTFTIVVVQIVVLGLTCGRRRTGSLAASAYVFGLAVLLVLGAGMAGGPLGAVGLLAALGLYGVGETLFQPSIMALVNDLAPDAERGRYNSVINLSFQAGAIAGPSVAGAVLARGWYVGLFVGLAAVCGLIALTALWSRRVISAAADLGRHTSRGCVER